MTSLPVLAMLRQIGPDDAALDDAEVSYNIKKGFHIMEYYSSRSLKVGEKSLKELGGVYK